MCALKVLNNTGLYGMIQRLSICTALPPTFRVKKKPPSSGDLRRYNG